METTTTAIGDYSNRKWQQQRLRPQARAATYGRRRRRGAYVWTGAVVREGSRRNRGIKRDGESERERGRPRDIAFVKTLRLYMD
ncbi:hypothetical protein L1049_015498 [Liquidambar formosana]|uniref:Uncharacterized protein n=1 Tax=Liquidambar formosana TaxID=63359 RepID=A0AAP0RXY6_LIQFO